ncbi:hypothetical protein E4J66_13865 [Actinomyces viscosus]|uniref:Uncharacterized protein n=1 Tax=Actinomyces viscosus TaxID=1656 RepID=A0A3S4V1J8_ACTVI|nr:hypothetical protein [Actinomyces viscosus]TFH50857.1 hypothetical protein E4J66_13865 [Actinomyces viscosus]VEI15040.1 Uncharacterised protein [Actinomyces viscosus]
MTDIENRDQRKQASIANIVTDTNLVQIAKLSAAALDSSIASINRLTIPRETQESLLQAVAAIAEMSQKMQQDWIVSLSKIQIQLPPIIFTPETRRSLTSITSTLSEIALPQIQQTSLAISNNPELISSLTQTISKLHVLNEDLNKRLAKSIAAIDFPSILKEYDSTIKDSSTFATPLGLDLEQLIDTQTLPIDATAGPEAYEVISKEAPELAASIDVAADKANTGLLSKTIVRYSLACSVLLIIAMAILVGNNNIKILPPEWAAWIRSITQIGAEGVPLAIMIGKGKSE